MPKINFPILIYLTYILSRISTIVLAKYQIISFISTTALFYNKKITDYLGNPRGLSHGLGNGFGVRIYNPIVQKQGLNVLIGFGNAYFSMDSHIQESAYLGEFSG